MTKIPKKNSDPWLKVVQSQNERFNKEKYKQL